jgi:hypothetical protein
VSRCTNNYINRMEDSNVNNARNKGAQLQIVAYLLAPSKGVRSATHHPPGDLNVRRARTMSTVAA